ncbi:sulfotransferase domain-containing protein [Methylotuvimicrobium alcaliphilum]|uniref:Sulfotransferase domain-containing protein n=1 Tax=Methylotuvimicrobium alcaliphilum (strain DSM 19304 / NCIMB 14124 / VKM B-2133 / 20Z) TaxID=1091494 RepID=G4SYU9_META2|nr:sulfotransferase domain-containing protein [Methylotuvimicrobium alcaliphilum]CCE24396.1 protein of unknown function [Methylotuvimicrobium alcaliphilum 20Z]
MIEKKFRINDPIRNFKTILRRLYKKKPYTGDKKLIIHCGYHRGGTTWFNNVLSAVAGNLGLRYQLCEPENIAPNTEIYLCNDSKIKLTHLSNYVGTHMIRDPRDLIVSGYNYHKHTHEPWAHIPRKEYDGKSYQEQLNSLNQYNGLMLEIERTSPSIIRMAKWDYSNTKILELKYEEVIQNEKEWWRKIFTHYGFSNKAVEDAISIAMQYQINAVKGKQVSRFMTDKHIRSGKEGQWKKMFQQEHKEYFHELFGDILIKLEYESDFDW